MIAVAMINHSGGGDCIELKNEWLQENKELGR